VHRTPPTWLALAVILTTAGAAAAGCNGTLTTQGDATGGAPGSGGGPAGGTAGAPGPAGSGGVPGAGGASATGGASGSGGARATGGTTGTAGATGAGGAGAGTQPFKGVANAACADLATLKTSWYYNWTLSPGSCASPGFVPTIAGKSEKTAAAVTTSLGRVASSGYTTVLGFNEPNKVDQSNLTVATAISLWPQVTANPAIRVGSPATSADAPGQAWFSDFMSQAQTGGLRVDFIAIHWYGWNAGSCDAKAVQLESYVKWAEAIPGNRPIWITEWGCLNLSNPDPATVQAFYTGAVAMFARHPRLERYAWYPWTTNNELVATGGVLTSLGTAFANNPSLK
jgi:Glycosyl hydrolase catalytic core